MEKKQRSSEKDIRLLKIIFYSSAFIFFSLGCTGLLSPEIFQEFMGTDSRSTIILSQALIAVGIIDAIIFPRMLDSGTNRK